VTAKGGVLDLRAEDFSKTIFLLDGEWEFYFGELFTPDDFADGIPKAGALIQVPISWDDAGYPKFGCATYRLIIKTNEPELLMNVPEVLESSAAWVNGVKVYETGIVGKTQSESAMGIKLNLINIRSENGLIEIIIQASNYRYFESGIAYSIELAQNRVLLNDFVLRFGGLSIFIGIAFAMFIYHIMLFIYRYTERACLFFALYCLITAVRFSIESDSIVPFMLTNGFGTGLFSIYMLAIIAQSLTIILFVHVVFNIKFNKIFTNITYCVIYGSAIIISLLPLGRLYVNFIFIIFIPIIFILIKVMRSKLLRESPYYILLVVSIGIFIVWVPVFRFLLGIPFVYMSGIFVNMFLLLSQGLLLSVSYSETKQREEKLAEQTESYRLKERQLIEEKALLESLNHTKSIFFSNVNHEMKTPLTIIATNIQIAEQFMDQNKITGAKELMRDAWQETMKMADIVTDSLEFARNQETAKPMGLFDFGEIINSTLLVFERLLNKKGNILKKEINVLPQINGNANMLADALINLLYNANSHTKDGVITVVWKNQNDNFILLVSDTGSGISPELLPHVFERGVTGGNGTGLGLSIVKSIMERHNGDITVESEVEKGTVATLVFPAFNEGGWRRYDR
jgi:signal transduction histidine kinase